MSHRDHLVLGDVAVAVDVVALKRRLDLVLGLVVVVDPSLERLPQLHELSLKVIIGQLKLGRNLLIASWSWIRTQLLRYFHESPKVVFVQ